MRALGVLAGVGSMLHEAESLGCKVLGNIEARSIFLTHTDPWELNFPGKSLRQHGEKIKDDWDEPDIILGHPPCGHHSILGQMKFKDDHLVKRTAWRAARDQDRGLLPVFIEHVKRWQPRIFALDNLPKMLETAATPEWWQHQLPNYRFTFVVIANYDYGTPQLRRRLWVIGTRGKRVFEFTPPKQRVGGPRTAWEAIRDLPWEPWIDDAALGHVHYRPEDKPPGSYYTTDDPAQGIEHISQMARLFLHIPPKQSWPYRTKSGRITAKAGCSRLNLMRPASVLSGGSSLTHPLTGWPLTPRERARLMSWPDTFKLIDVNKNTSRSILNRLVTFTGKGVPSAFVRYLLPQLIKHLKRV